ncbi:hypothetical protein KA050_04375 [Candidatus Gracilibacteria bacterium]|nr:hypothetical protein [Candidatus Gracilibacteria bacterium]
MKTPAQKKAIKEKLAIRMVGKTPPKVKKGGPTGELALFKIIAMERLWCPYELPTPYVKAKHITPGGFVCEKLIHLDNLTVTNFSHIIGKGRDKTKRLDPKNIEIVSRAYHHYQHTGQVEQGDFIN